MKITLTPRDPFPPYDIHIENVSRVNIKSLMNFLRNPHPIISNFSDDDIAFFHMLATGLEQQLSVK
jgi:hypothetical protein